MNPFFDGRDVLGRLRRLAEATGSAELAEAVRAFAPHSARANKAVLRLLNLAATRPGGVDAEVRADILRIRADVGAC